jgi:hypothetical protein
MMLDDLDKVNWKRLRHAFGPADEVPELLRQLTADDERERDLAALELYGCLWHDGGTFEVTPHTIPFLVELLDPAAGADRAWILSFLAHIANGRAPLEDRREVFGEAFAGTRPRADYDHATEQFNAESHAMILKALPRVKKAMSDDDPDVRAAAAYLLATFPESADDTAVLADGQLGDDDPLVRAGAGLALTYLLRGGERSAERVRAAFETEDHPFPKWVFAWLWTMLAGEEISGQARTELWRVVTDPSPVEDDWARSPWSLIDCASMTCDACRGLDLEHDMVSAHRLLKALDHADTYSSLVVADALLQATKVNGCSDWTDPQRAVLRAIADSDRVWSFNLNARQLMERYDLPLERDELRAWLA